MKKISFWQRSQINIKAWALTLLFDLLYRTIRLEIIDPDNTLQKAAKKELKALFALFHHSYLIPFYINKHRDYAVFTSESVDGEVLDRIIKKKGYRSFKIPENDDPKTGARAAVNMIQALKNGNQACIVVDGPTGPYEKVKPGIFPISLKSGAKIYPAGIGMKRKWLIKRRWDNFKLPLPFTKVVAVSGKPFEWSGDLSENSLAKESVRLENILKDLDRKAEELAKR